jgi:hypothetical protein
MDELMAKLPDFRRAYLEDSLAVDEYAEFGPVAFFRDSFIRSWKRVLDLAEERRAAPQRQAREGSANGTPREEPAAAQS